ncbi:MAG: hypothetical protein M1826_004162 [Phylliscum demangeonii]|nr:MAG: hypothetical protein M1826_004162 [Phylliscum demangeonii]
MATSPLPMRLAPCRGHAEAMPRPAPKAALMDRHWDQQQSAVWVLHHDDCDRGSLHDDDDQYQDDLPPDEDHHTRSRWRPRWHHDGTMMATATPKAPDLLGSGPGTWLRNEQAAISPAARVV